MRDRRAVDAALEHAGDIVNRAQGIPIDQGGEPLNGVLIGCVAHLLRVCEAQQVMIDALITRVDKPSRADLLMTPLGGATSTKEI